MSKRLTRPLLQRSLPMDSWTSASRTYRPDAGSDGRRYPCQASQLLFAQCDRNTYPAVAMLTTCHWVSQNGTPEPGVPSMGSLTLGAPSEADLR
jgi:hypothetical protein